MRGMDWKDRAFVLQPVLTERFGLKFHHETRLMPVYELVVAKGGPKLQPPKAPDAPDAFKVDGHSLAPGTMLWTSNEIRGVAVDMPNLARGLTGNAHRVILDKTGLKGSFDFVIKVSDQSEQAAPPGDTAAGTLSTEGPGQNLFGALHDQLGLDLKPAKVPMDVIVIDDAHLPTSN